MIFKTDTNFNKKKKKKKLSDIFTSNRLHDHIQDFRVIKRQVGENMNMKLKIH